MRISTGFVRSLTFSAGLALVGFAASGCGTDPTASVPGPNEVQIHGLAFMPATKVVPAGTTVTWVNQDAVDHTATGGAAPETWDSGRFGQNRTFSRRFTTPGTYAYTCAVHPDMHGTIIVE